MFYSWILDKENISTLASLFVVQTSQSGLIRHAGFGKGLIMHKNKGASIWDELDVTISHASPTVNRVKWLRDDENYSGLYSLLKRDAVRIFTQF